MRSVIQVFQAAVDRGDAGLLRPLPALTALRDVATEYVAKPGR
ncbi:MAG: hypothetical protein JWO88_2488 [Frankiales bacterium]|nr:hypothetical protein [Frankiales bacterium]